MTEDEYIDHEVRIKMLEQTCKQLNTKMNALITIAITGFILPIVIKFLVH